MSQPSPRLHRPSDAAVLAGLILFRAINSCLVKTYYSADEYWQALEVAYKIVFDHGFLTWEWAVALRSVVYPALFAGLYKALAAVHLDDGSLFIYAPRLLQSLLAAIADYYTYRLANRLFENQMIANWTLFVSVTSWWNFFASTRTLANSTEAALTIVALYYWPFPSASASPSSTSAEKAGKPSEQGRLTIALAIAFLTCIFRPTAAIMWIFLGGSLLVRYCMNGDIKSIITTLASVVVMGGIAILGAAVLDSTLFYDDWVLTPLNFLRINVLEGISLFYGTSPWHWYLSQGLPMLFGIYLPFVLYGSWHALRSNKGLNANMKHQVVYVCLWTLVIYSSLQHKEWRFLYPIVYPLLPFVGEVFYGMYLPLQQNQKTSRTKYAALIAIVAVNAVMAWFTTLVHQRGVVDVMEWIRQEARTGQVRSVGFIMPCHSTPWLPSVHRRGAEPLNMWFVTCDPPLGDVDPITYLDESDIFYSGPVAYMDERLESIPVETRSEDSHLVLFEDLLHFWPEVPPWLSDHGYHECARFFNSYFHDDDRRRGDVLVYCRDT
ncbi:Alg9-like mannosyltransferase family-domain-containing protein [Mortierella sp. GBAus27b]|nr:Alg9-like mannosyltransferase family-domain-containing protein [Mortierella sp. GBAus27b]